ncbi:MerR family DNA-binding protein, partial [Escherichia coli]|uniref:MerR family DNA-binding protein n=1 Tax=Escherichia coli TaxID=562 RepID=UPI0015BF21CE
DQPCAEARAVAAAHLEDVQAKIADLTRMERVLKGVVARCADGTLQECPLIETLFQASPTLSAPSPSAAAGTRRRAISEMPP